MHSIKADQKVELV